MSHYDSQDHHKMQPTSLFGLNFSNHKTQSPLLADEANLSLRVAVSFRSFLLLDLGGLPYMTFALEGGSLKSR